MVTILTVIALLVLLVFIFGTLEEKKSYKDEIITATFSEGKWLFKLEEKEPMEYGKTPTALKHL